MKKNKDKKSFIQEFKEFISKGNVLDLAIGVVIGSAFSSIVTSLVNDIIMPVVGVIIGNIDFKTLAYTFKSGDSAVVLSYGMFIQNVVNFLIIAFVLFMVIKLINKFKKDEEAKEEVKEDKYLVLLESINKELKKQNENNKRG